jgi:periplasmic divalent cation tolerance protein
VTVTSVYAVFGTEEEATRIGRAMVEQRLAACVNILGPVRSIYRWQGKIEDAAEVAALFKTRRDGADRLIAAIVEAHSYDVPAVVTWPIDKLPAAFAEWVEASVD